MVSVIILILFLLVVMYVLWIPVILYVDTATDQYYLKLKGLSKASIEQHDKQLLKIKLSVLFLKFNIYPLKQLNLYKQKKSHHTKKKRTHMSISKSLQVLKTFKVERLFMDIDTGNYLLNAQLYPLVIFLNYNNGNFHINFQGRNQLVLHLQSRPIYIIKKLLTLKKFNYGFTF